LRCGATWEYSRNTQRPDGSSSGAMPASVLFCSNWLNARVTPKFLPMLGPSTCC